MTEISAIMVHISAIMVQISAIMVFEGLLFLTLCNRLKRQNMADKESKEA